MCGLQYGGIFLCLDDRRVIIRAFPETVDLSLPIVGYSFIAFTIEDTILRETSESVCLFLCVVGLYVHLQDVFFQTLNSPVLHLA